MNDVVDWLMRRWKAIALLLTGTFIGMLLCLPLIPWLVPDSFVSLLGAALGAGITVFSTYWLVDSARQNERREIRDLLLDEVREFHGPFDLKAAEYRTAVLGADYDCVEELDVWFESYAATCTSMEAKLSHLQALFHQLGAHGYIAYSEFTQYVSLVAAFCRLGRADRLGRGFDNLLGLEARFISAVDRLSR